MSLQVKRNSFLVALAAALVTSAAMAAPVGFVEALGLNVSPTPLYAAPGTLGPDGEWHMPNAVASQGSVVEADAGRVWFVAPFGGTATLDWTGSTLNTDTSAGGTMSGSFNAGGTLTITGDLYNEFFVPVFTGVLLTGTVSSFTALEPATPNFIDTGVAPTFTPTGGVLADGSLGIGALQLAGQYYMAFTVTGARQNGGDLEDLQSDIVTVDSYKMQLIAIPEPASLALLGLGALVAVRRRR